MRSISTAAALKAAILQLEQQQAGELAQLKATYRQTCESLKPINIIKGTFKAAVAAPDLKTDIVNAAIGLTTGILTKKLLIGKALNPLSKLLGVVLEVFVANKVTKNAADIKSIGNIILDKLINKKEKV